MNEVTHVTVTLDNAMLQTIKMGLAQLQMQATAIEVHLNSAVQTALEAANPPETIPATGAAKSNGKSHAQARPE